MHLISTLSTCKLKAHVQSYVNSVKQNLHVNPLSKYNFKRERSLPNLVLEASGEILHTRIKKANSIPKQFPRQHCNAVRRGTVFRVGENFNRQLVSGIIQRSIFPFIS